MLIPERLEEKLAEDKSLRSTVDAAVADFGPWLRESNLPFFPDYTDHGTGHVEGVLATASSLIGDEAWEGVTAADSAILILAALLHDCAMHLTEEGFHALVSGSTHTKRIQGFGDVDWPELWREFLFLAKRFDDRTLTGLFGSPVAVRTPPADKGEMERNDRLLIGEFVRRHHPRLAHEIAARGVPGPTDNPIRLSARLDPKLADMAGLVARSHGLPLRATFNYLNKHYHRREYKGVHAVFLMAVLRVADYLQIQAERAPKQVLQVKDIRSPISRREWKAHHSVDNIVPYEDDPESILIQATPPDVRTFLRLKDWLAGIQEELDTSWAVLGEVYGPAEKLRRLGLVIRRVRSNLDDDRAFAKIVDYVPRRVEFDIARSEILKLLVRPLYGDKPEVGIRELLQNSLDAVRELWDLEEQSPGYRDAEVIPQEADVVMWLDEPDESGRAAFTISDRGVGMTEEVIADYFLKVGASYRRSEAWVKQHEEADAEEAGSPQLKSRVLRSGRFGIGALAAFLLGDELEVTTRHVAADRGLRFTTSLNSEVVELQYDDSLKVGTTVRTTLTRSTFERLASYGRKGPPKQHTDRYQKYLSQEKWDWYCLRSPSVVRLLGRGRRVLPQRLVVPGLRDELPRGWYQAESADYRAVYCNHNHDPGLVCNGLHIRAAKDETFWEPLTITDPSHRVMVKPPMVSVFDPDGNLPLDLTRSSLSSDEFSPVLHDGGMKYALAYLLHGTPTSYQHLGEPSPGFIFTNWNPIMEGARLLPFFYTGTGLSICEPWNLLRAGLKRCLLLSPAPWRDTPLVPPPAGAFDAIFLFDQPPSEINRAFELLSGFSHLSHEDSFLWPARGARLLVPTRFARVILGARSFSQRKTIREEWANNQWTILTAGNPPATRFTSEYMEKLSGRTGAPTDVLAAEWFLEENPREVEPAGMALYWREIIREPVIPYEITERRAKLAYAYEVLAPYIRKIERDAR